MGENYSTSEATPTSPHRLQGKEAGANAARESSGWACCPGRRKSASAGQEWAEVRATCPQDDADGPETERAIRPPEVAGRLPLGLSIALEDAVQTQHSPLGMSSWSRHSSVSSLQCPQTSLDRPLISSRHPESGQGPQNQGQAHCLTKPLNQRQGPKSATSLPESVWLVPRIQWLRPQVQVSGPKSNKAPES